MKSIEAKSAKSQNIVKKEETKTPKSKKLIIKKPKLN